MTARILLCLGLALAATACASTGTVPRPFPTPGGRPDAPSDATATAFGRGEALAATALGLQGVPYRDGGADPSGFDCSGLVQYVFAQHAVALPRSVEAQMRVGRAVQAGQIEPGDLLFFTTVAPGASHVGIALNGDEFIHAPTTTGEVRVERLSAPYWAHHFIGARRVL
jgi:cell wall-associated NlpC family hydrolase